MNTAVATAALAFLGACTSMAPKYERPAAPVAAEFPDAAASGVTSAPATDIDWQAYFADARLKQLIDIALKNNRDLRVAVLNIEAARATYQIRRSDLFPTVNVGMNMQRQNYDVKELYTVGASVSGYELDLWGRVRSLSDAALASYLGTEEARKSVQMSLVSQVAQLYYTLLGDEAALKVTRETLTTREDSFKLTKLKFDNGAASELDFRQSEALLENARASHALQTRLRAQDLNALALLLGQGVPTDLPGGLELTNQGLVAELPAGVPSEVLARRPDVRQAEQQLIAANANIGAARAAFFPRITLTANGGTASTELSGLFKSGTGVWSFTPSITLPIFDAGRNQANLDVAKVNREIAVAQYEKAVQTAFREVADALAGRANLDEQARATAAATAAEEARFKLADLRYRNGASSYLDVLDAQRSLYTAQLALVQVQTAQVQNRVALYKALGGGWTEPKAQ
jgi:multidrug efflux system outer membrane protein